MIHQRSAAPIDTTLAAKRVVEYKKARELESKVEELVRHLLDTIVWITI